MIDITKPLWTKRGGVVTVAMAGGLGRYPIGGNERFDGVDTYRTWTARGTSYMKLTSQLDLTNDPPDHIADAGKMVEEPKPDPVNHPAHYTQGKVECIDAIESMLTPEEYRGFLKGALVNRRYLFPGPSFRVGEARNF
jgi:hypothetical protein